MWETYENEQRQIRAPEHLKARTLEKMKASKMEKRFSLLKPQRALLMACSLFVLFWWASGELFGTSEVVFEPITSNLRHFQPIGEAIEMEQFELEMDGQLSQLTLTDLFLDMEGSGWFWDESSLEGRGTYVFSNEERRLEISLSYERAPLSTNSILNQRAVALYYHETLLHITYTALFIEGNHLYHIRATELTEQEFIAYVEEILRFLE